MAVLHFPLVNQKLAYAKALLAQLVSLDSAQRGSKLLAQALTEGAMFHLVLAYRFYLRELAESMRLKNLTDLESVNQLSERMAAQDRYSSEVEELLGLANDSGSWLARLLGAYERLSKSPTPIVEPKAFVQSELGIPLIDITAELPAAELMDLARMQELASLFTALIQRQRETTAEY
jgi:hypothetical protein